MKKNRILIMLFAMVFLAGTVSAEMYMWTDENGVKSYSNSPPPEGVQAESSWSEIAYDEEADLARMADDDRAIEAWHKEKAEQEALDKQIAEAVAQKQKAEDIEKLEAQQAEITEQLRAKRRYIQGRAKRRVTRLNNLNRELAQLKKTSGDPKRLKDLEFEKEQIIEALVKNKRYFHRGGQEMVNEYKEVSDALKAYGK